MTHMNLKVIILSEIQTKRIHSSIIPFICNFRKCKLFYSVRKQISGCMVGGGGYEEQEQERGG